MIWSPITEARFEQMLATGPVAVQNGLGFLVGERIFLGIGANSDSPDHEEYFEAGPVSRAEFRALTANLAVPYRIIKGWAC